MPPDMYDDVIDTPDLDESRVVYEKLVGELCLLKTCRSKVLNRIKDRLHKHAESAKMSL